MKNKFLIITLSLMAIISNSCTSASNGETGSKSDCDSTQVVLDNIMTRCSIRQFTDRQISKDALENILKAGMAAPSAMDKRPWSFIVVTEREVLDSLNNNHPYANLKTATAAILVCGVMDKAGEGIAKDYWVQDCSAVTENILLAAHAYGLGAVWCGVYPVPERMEAMAKVLSIPEGIVPLNVITMGYPDQEPNVKDKWNPECIHYQKW